MESAAARQRVRDVPLDIGVDRIQERGVVFAELPVSDLALLDQLVGDLVRAAVHDPDAIGWDGGTAELAPSAEREALYALVVARGPVRSGRHRGTAAVAAGCRLRWGRACLARADMAEPAADPATGLAQRRVVGARDIREDVRNATRTAV